MGYNWAKAKMKRCLVLTMGFLILLANVSFAETEKQAKTTIDEVVVVNLSETEASSTAIELLVKASDAVDELCNYFNGSWADVGLTLYCSFGGDVYTCTAYKVVKAACGINGAIRLTIEGDYEAALKKLLTSSTTVYTVVKIAGEFHIEKD